MGDEDSSVASAQSTSLFSEATLKERFKDLFVIAGSHCARFNSSRGDAPPVSVNEAALLHVVWSAYDDIARFKAYHHEHVPHARSNAVKRAAYLTKWILRLKPIVRAPVEEALTPEALRVDRSRLVNEHFALRVGCRALICEKTPRFRLAPHAHYRLTYDFLYRELSGDALVSIYEILDQAAGDTLLTR